MGKLIYLDRFLNKNLNKLSVLKVADYFLSQNHRDSYIPITLEKLQALLYYAQAWSLVLCKEQLFEESMELWGDCPINIEINQIYKSCEINLIGLNPEVNLTLFTENQMDVMNLVWDCYACLDILYLKYLICQEDPIKKVKIRLTKNGIQDNMIYIDDIEKYYNEKYNEEI